MQPRSQWRRPDQRGERLCDDPVLRVPNEHNSVQAFGWSKTRYAINNISERDGSDDVANQWPHKRKSEATICNRGVTSPARGR
jgi:hypothetical protein